MEDFDDVEVWARIIEGNARAIARRLTESGVVCLTRDYVVENGEVFFSVEVHDGLSS